VTPRIFWFPIQSESEISPHGKAKNAIDKPLHAAKISVILQA